MSALLGFLVRHAESARGARRLLFGVFLAGAIAGFGTSALLATANRAIGAQAAERPLLLALFAGLLVLVSAAGIAARLFQIRLSSALIERLRLQLSRSLLAAPLLDLERLGASSPLAALNQDIPALAGALVALPQLALNGALVVGCFGYLAWLSWPAFALTAGFVLPVAVIYRWASGRAVREQAAARIAEERLYRHFGDLVLGQKELQLNRRRGTDFLARLLRPSGLESARRQVAGQTLYAGAGSFGQAMFFVAIGLVLFLLPRFAPISAAVMTGYVLTLVYLLIPTDGILNAFPALGQARVSLERLARLGLSLDPSPTATAVGAPSGAPRVLAWNDAVCSYGGSGEDAFRLGPITFEIRAPEILFLTGGNGSGKTTLGKLIVGLYPPESGEVRVDGVVEKNPEGDGHRGRFAAIFSDFHLFADLLGIERRNLDERAAGYLRRLRLDHKVTVREGTLSTLDLSQGERKRLALVAAYLEDRPIYLFDEWAADQDPEFKQVFYRELLPDLKARGKVAIVISHDDRFFGVADRIIKLDRGRIEIDGAT